jgi:hypothetical protein
VAETVEGTDPVSEALSQACEAGLEVVEITTGKVAYKVVAGDTVIYVWRHPASVENSARVIRDFVAERSKIA